jgi:putative Holliday junction resolvase
VSSAGSRPRRVLAVDFGEARTGLAATDWTGTICLPLERLDIRGDGALAAAIAEVCRERETELVLLGIPLAGDGGHGERARRTQAFQAVLATAVHCPVQTVDESLTTDEAHERLKQTGMKAARRKQYADSVAALVILERWRAGLT